MTFPKMPRALSGGSKMSRSQRSFGSNHREVGLVAADQPGVLPERCAELTSLTTGDPQAAIRQEGSRGIGTRSRELAHAAPAICYGIIGLDLTDKGARGPSMLKIARAADRQHPAIREQRKHVCVACLCEIR